MTSADYEQRFAALENKVKEILDSAPGCHDFYHVERVLHNARMLAELLPDANFRVVELAALLHDIGRPDEMREKGRICHAEIGAGIAVKLLPEFKFTDPELIEAIGICVARHRFRKGDAPVAIEEKIVYDADKLDSVGAVGIGRAFHFAGRIGAKLHNTREKALNSDSYSQEDTAYREYLVKLRKIPDRMLTEAGRKIATERAKFMDEFFRHLNNEVYNGK